MKRNESTIQHQVLTVPSVSLHGAAITAVSPIAIDGRVLILTFGLNQSTRTGTLSATDSVPF